MISCISMSGRFSSVVVMPLIRWSFTKFYKCKHIHNVIYPQVCVYHEASVSNNHSKLMYKISEILRENHVAFSLRCRTGQNDWRKTGRYQTMFQLIVSCTYNFIINDQNIGPLSLISSSPYLLLSLSHSLTPPLSSFLLLPLSLPPSLPLSLSLYLHLSSDLISLSPPLPLFLSYSSSILLYLSPLSLPGTRTTSRHRALYYQVSCHYHVSYLGNQGYPGNQLLQFLFQLLSGWTLKSSNPESSRSQSDHGHLIWKLKIKFITSI